VPCGGETGAGSGQQVQLQGGHVSPETHAGHAQPQPPPPLPGTGVIATQRPLGGHGSVEHPIPSEIHEQACAVSAQQDWRSVCSAQAPAGGGSGACWQTPERHGCPSMQGMPSAYHVQRSDVSAEQLCESVNAVHGSVLGGGAGGAPQSHGAHAVFGGQAGQVHVGTDVEVPLLVLPPVLVPVPVPATPTVPAPHAQSHGLQVWPAAHGGQAQVHVLCPHPVPPVLLPPFPQAQSHGWQLCPAAQGGQAQVHVPPPLLPDPPQSHCTAGHSLFGGHEIGCTQAQPPPLRSRPWQNPSLAQSWPAGQRIGAEDVASTADQAQRSSAWHIARSVILPHGSCVTQTPDGQSPPAGQAMPSATHWHPFAVSPRQASAVA
jgi:hypothetical protein